MLAGTEEAQRRAARLAALVYPISFAIVVFVEFGIQERLIVAGNAAETARNILGHEGLFRLGIALDLLYCAGVVTALAAFYVILVPAGRTIALIAAICRLVYATMWVLMTANLFDALRLLRGKGPLGMFDAPRLQALASLQLNARFDEYYIGLLFWAVSSTLFSYLWLRARYVPRGLAAFGILSSAWAAACTFVFIITPGFAGVVNLWWFDSPLGLFELALSFWLLFRGLGRMGGGGTVTL